MKIMRKLAFSLSVLTVTFGIIAGYTYATHSESPNAHYSHVDSDNSFWADTSWPSAYNYTRCQIINKASTPFIESDSDRCWGTSYSSTANKKIKPKSTNVSLRSYYGHDCSLSN